MNTHERCDHPREALPCWHMQAVLPPWPALTPETAAEIWCAARWPAVEMPHSNLWPLCALQGHILSLLAFNGMLFSGSNDSCIHVWKYDAATGIFNPAVSSIPG